MTSEAGRDPALSEAKEALLIIVANDEVIKVNHDHASSDFDHAHDHDHVSDRDEDGAP